MPERSAHHPPRPEFRKPALRGWHRPGVLGLILLTAVSVLTLARTQPAQAAPSAARTSSEVVAAFDALRGYIHTASGLNDGQQTSLISELDAAEASYQRGEVCSASMSQLQAYLNDVSALRQAGLSSANELYRRGWLVRFDVLASLPSGTTCGVGIDWIVDPSLQPDVTALPDPGGGSPRPVVSMMSDSGAKADFVANELIVTSTDPERAATVAARWHGEIVSHTDPATFGLNGPTQYLIRVAPSPSSTDALSDDLASINPGVQSLLRFSSTEAAELVAAAAHEKLAGTTVGLNFVSFPTSIGSGSTTEAPTGDNGFADGTTGYTPDAYQWNYLDSGSVQNIGTTRAWTLLSNAGRLTPGQVRIGVHDGGFVRDADWPTGGTVDRFGVQGWCWKSCSWHGSEVVKVAMGVPDNGFGTAGPAGPVAVPLTRFYDGALYDAATDLFALAADGARIINMSWDVPHGVPAAVSFAVAPFEQVTTIISLSGRLLFAAAGNEGENVDAQDCFGVCWESSEYIPCELTGVICVGALAKDSRLRAFFSNWGTQDVDIFAPGYALVGPDPGVAPPKATAAAGTSFASPYAAGVAALVMAANPSLNANAVWTILRETALPPDGFTAKPYVDAYDAVAAALPPLIHIQRPVDASSISRGTAVDFSAFVWSAGHGDATISWSSDRDGPIGTGNGIEKRDLSFGTHTITATARFPDGTTVQDHVSLTITNDPPQVTILSPTQGATVYSSQQIRFDARVYDPNEVETNGQLPDANIHWYLDSSGTPFAQGPSVRKELDLAPGEYLVTALATDGSLFGEDSVHIQVQADPSVLPPTAVIVSPHNGDVILADHLDASNGMYYAEVTLQGYGTDPDGGAIPDSQLVWYEYRPDGSVGELLTGSTGTVRLYVDSGGYSTTHHIFLRASDSVSFGEDDISVTVETLY